MKQILIGSLAFIAYFLLLLIMAFAIGAPFTGNVYIIIPSFIAAVVAIQIMNKYAVKLLKLMLP